MTVIANLLVQGVPVLIADTVVTTNEDGAKSIAVPTVDSLPTLKKPISSFCRKVYLVDKKLAVAWTGSRSEAGIVIPALKARIRQVGVSEQALIGYLESCTNCQRPLKLLGWIAGQNKEPRPFWWSSADPRDVLFDEYDVEGAGEELFKKIFFDAGMSSTGGGLRSHELAAAASLSGISRLLTAETVKGLLISP